MREMTIWDLKNILENVLEGLDEYSDEKVLDVHSSTYWIYDEFISFPWIGFIDLAHPVEESDEDED